MNRNGGFDWEGKGQVGERYSRKAGRVKCGWNVK